MMIEWVFLMSILSGPFDPATELGWRDVQRSRFAYRSPLECIMQQEAMVRHIKAHPIWGGAVVITECQPKTRP